MSVARSNRLPMLLALSGAAAIMVAPTPAYAGTGCNGVINILVWGCAPWDNNNGAQFAYYRKRQVSVPANQSQIVVRNGQQMVLYRGQYMPLIGNDGASLIGQDGASLRVWSGN